jgi:hypothetical protein
VAHVVEFVDQRELVLGHGANLPLETRRSFTSRATGSSVQRSCRSAADARGSEATDASGRCNGLLGGRRLPFCASSSQPANEPVEKHAEKGPSQHQS